MPKANPPDRDALFPTLTEAQMARLMPVGKHRRVAAGEVIFEPGTVVHNFFVVLKGRLEVVSPTGRGEIQITSLGSSEFTGEINTLAGRPTLVRMRAAVDSELLEIGQP